jgi:hypothetical protein
MASSSATAPAACCSPTRGGASWWATHQAEVTGIDSGQTYLDEERDIFHRRLEQASTGQNLALRAHRAPVKTGNIFPAEFSFEDARQCMVQVIVRDITERPQP